MTSLLYGVWKSVFLLIAQNVGIHFYLNWIWSPQVWFQNARAKFRRNLLRQESTGVDKVSDGSTLQGGTPSGPASEISNASMSPSSTPTTLTDLTNPTMPTVTSVLTSVPGGMDVHECRSPSQTTLTSLFWWTEPAPQPHPLTSAPPSWI